MLWCAKTTASFSQSDVSFIAGRRAGPEGLVVTRRRLLASSCSVCIEEELLPGMGKGTVSCPYGALGESSLLSLLSG